MTKQKSAMRELTWEEFFKENPGEPLDVLRQRHAEDAAWAEAALGLPDEGTLRIRIKPGRPPKGEEAPVSVKAIKMPVSFWDNFQSKADAAGLSLHAAMRSALMEWAGKHRAS